MGKRDLSLFGRIQILKTFAISKLVLPATTICFPERDVIKRINSIFYQFLWRSPNKVKRTKIVQAIDKGGLNMIDPHLFFNALKANWVNRIKEADPNADCWVQLPMLFLKQFDINGLDIRFNFDDTVFFPAVEHLPCFYKEMVKCYNKAFVNDKDTFVKNILTQPLWRNKFITEYARPKKHILFLRNWVRSGIRTVGDLVFRNGILDEHHVYQTLINKQNMYTEVALVKKALLPYKQFLKQENILATNIVTFKRSRDFYMESKRQLFAGSVIRAKLLGDRVEEDEV